MAAKLALSPLSRKINIQRWKNSRLQVSLLLACAFVIKLKNLFAEAKKQYTPDHAAAKPALFLLNRIQR